MRAGAPLAVMAVAACILAGCGSSASCSSPARSTCFTARRNRSPTKSGTLTRSTWGAAVAIVYGVCPKSISHGHSSVTHPSKHG